MTQQFLQFYGKHQGMVTDDFFYTLCNGFSYIERDIPIEWIQWLRDNAAPFIPKADIVYVSCWYQFHITTVIQWAQQYPNTKFIVGGPAIWPTCVASDMLSKKWPPNLELRFGLAEQIINKPLQLDNWNLSFPLTDLPWVYSYHLENACYWAKCNFCSFSDKDLPKDSRGYDVAPLYDAPKGIVFLATQSLSPQAMHILGDLNYKDKYYQVYIRGDKECYEALKKVVGSIASPNKLRIRIGIEFPSDRMLARMGKGTTIDELLQFINMCRSYGFPLTLSYITAWPELVESDIVDARRFFAGIEDSNDLGILHTYRRLVVHDDRYGLERTPIEHKKIIVGYFPVLTEYHKELDRQWQDILFARRVKCCDFRQESL